MTGPDEKAMALAWLLGCAPDDPNAPAHPPDATPLVNVRCSGREPQCMFGAVYETPPGLLFTGVQTIRVGLTVTDKAKRRARAAILLTYPDGRPRAVTFLPLSCRHGQAGYVEPERHVEAVRRLAIARMSAPPETRPHEYVVHGRALR